MSMSQICIVEYIVPHGTFMHGTKRNFQNFGQRMEVFYQNFLFFSVPESQRSNFRAKSQTKKIFWQIRIPLMKNVSAGPVPWSLFSKGLVVQVVPSDEDSRTFDRGCG